MSSSKKIPVKHCSRSLLKFIEWRCSQLSWHFLPIFWNYCPSNLLSGSPAPPPFPCVKEKYSIQYTDSERLGGGGGGGVLIPVGDQIMQEFNTLYLTRFKTYKIARPSPSKPRRRGGFRQINICRKVPLQVIFSDDDILHCFLSVSSFYALNPRPGIRMCFKEHKAHGRFVWFRFLPHASSSSTARMPLS